ncbi:MAG: methionine adenosyltransferase domain-containing protein [Patescibacteria group bacterium]
MMKVAESVLAGHPDKVCDQVADAIVDEFLHRDSHARVQVEVFAGHGAMMISGDVDSRADFDCAAIAKRVYKDIGYDDVVEPFVHLGTTEREWAALVSKGAACEPAICHGFATAATREMLPQVQVFAHALARQLDEARKHDEKMRWVKPDGRVLVVMDGKEVTHVVIFCQHDAGVKVQEVHSGMLERVIRPVIGSLDHVKLFVNPAGPFTQGGLSCATGQSGRRGASDLYGGLVPHGDVALSGKSPDHPLRAGSYMARHIAKSLVASNKARQALVKLVYITGRTEPIIVEAIGDNGADLTSAIRGVFDLSLDAIVKKFNLRKPIYQSLATYGHMGRETPWEQPTILS